MKIVYTQIDDDIITSVGVSFDDNPAIVYPIEIADLEVRRRFVREIEAESKMEAAKANA